MGQPEQVGREEVLFRMLEDEALPGALLPSRQPSTPHHSSGRLSMLDGDHLQHGWEKAAQAPISLAVQTEDDFAKDMMEAGLGS